MVPPAVLNPCGIWHRQTLVVIQLECDTHGTIRVPGPGSHQIRLQPAYTLCALSALTRMSAHSNAHLPLAILRASESIGEARAASWSKAASTKPVENAGTNAVARTGQS